MHWFFFFCKMSSFNFRLSTWDILADDGIQRYRTCWVFAEPNSLWNDSYHCSNGHESGACATSNCQYSYTACIDCKYMNEHWRRIIHNRSLQMLCHHQKKNTQIFRRHSIRSQTKRALLFVRTKFFVFELLI